MTATTLEAKIQTGVQAYAPLVAILAARPDGKAACYEMQEYEGQAFPSMTFLLVSTVPAYGAAFRAEVVRSRVQFTIWDTDPQRARSVETQLMNFLDQFNAWNAGDQNAIQRNQIAMQRQGGNPQTQPLTFWRITDAFIWNNQNL